MTSKDTGDAAESRVFAAFDRAGFELSSTKASGQCRGDGDFMELALKACPENPYSIYLEVKSRSTHGHGLSKSQLIKGRQQAKKFSPPRLMIFVTENVDRDLMIHMDLEDFLDILTSAMCPGW